MIIFPKAVVLFLALATTQAQDNCNASLICNPTTASPTLDGDLSDWAHVQGIETKIFGAMGGQAYQPGNAIFKCLYDTTHIFFSLEIPGQYMFSSSDNHKCASIATMFKMGEDATFYGMGGCPQASSGCSGGVPTECDSHRVDIGAHWELKGTEQGQKYSINSGTGNDDVANKDDEYAVSPYCRFDDDDQFAANEWEGAWSHSLAAEAETGRDSVGSYQFELSRLLATESSTTDKQLSAGKTYSFGIAYWDPNESEDGSGWMGHSHYVTGCGSEWIDLVLAEGAGASTDEYEPSAIDSTSGSASTHEYEPSAIDSTSGSGHHGLLNWLVVAMIAAAANPF